MSRALAGALWAGAALPVVAVSAPYVDRVLEEGPQPALKLERSLDPEGLARSWRVETTVARDRSGPLSGTSSGVTLSGHVETPHHGVLSMSLSLSRFAVEQAGAPEQRDTSYLWRIDQVGMPLDGGWSANHSVGNISALQVPMARAFGRIGLPTTPIAGASALYTQGATNSYALSFGQPGVYTGWGTSGFEHGTGRALFAGGQHALTPSSTLGIQVNDAQDVTRADLRGLRYSTRGAWAGWRWEGQAPWSDTMEARAPAGYRRRGALELQANAINTDTSGPNQMSPGNRSGAWLDARWRSQWLDQSGGFFYLDPDLRWGTYDIVSDLRGVYWNGELAMRRWYLSVASEWAESLTGRSAGGSFLNLSGQYRMDTRTTLLGAFAIRRGQAPGESAQLGVEQGSEWGRTRWQVDMLRTESRNAVRAGADHNFAFAGDGTLSLSLALERDTQQGVRNDAVVWGLVGSIQPWTGVTLDANVRGSQGDLQRVVNGGVGAGWTISPSWSLLAQWTHTRGQDLRPLAVLSPVSQAAEQLALQPYSANRVQLTLRYQDQAGQSVAPIGGAPGAGSGGVTGYVFYDSNDNGRRDALEPGVPEVAIRLDGRYVTRTDSQGRYEFPFVAAGEHWVEVMPDNLPLPWNLALPGQQMLDVRVRRTTTRDFAIRREMTSAPEGEPIASR